MYSAKEKQLFPPPPSTLFLKGLLLLNIETGHSPTMEEEEERGFPGALRRKGKAAHMGDGGGWGGMPLP